MICSIIQVLFCSFSRDVIRGRSQTLEPNDWRYELSHGEVIPGAAFVAGGDAAAVFDFLEEAFDEVLCAMDMRVIRPHIRAVFSRRECRPANAPGSCWRPPAC